MEEDLAGHDTDVQDKREQGMKGCLISRVMMINILRWDRW
jgi:hypothetical protein